MRRTIDENLARYFNQDVRSFSERIREAWPALAETTDGVPIEWEKDHFLKGYSVQACRKPEQLYCKPEQLVENSGAFVLTLSNTGLSQTATQPKDESSPAQPRASSFF